MRFMLRSMVWALVGFFALPAVGWAQSSPGFSTGQIPTAAQWNSYFAGKIDTSAVGTSVAPFSITPFGATTAVPLTTTAGDLFSVRGFGAVLNGSTNDSAAFNAARAAAVSTNQPVIQVPSGGTTLNIPGLVTTSAGSIIGAPVWELNGEALTNLAAFGTDMLQGYLNGGVYYRRNATVGNASPMLRIDATYNSTTGATGVGTNFQLNCGLPNTGVASPYAVWCGQSIMHSDNYGANGETIAFASSNFRDATALADGMGPRALLTASYIETNDQTGQAANVSGSVVSQEMDVYANGTDGVSGYNRIIQALNIGDSVATSNRLIAPARVGTGIGIGSNNADSYFGTVLNVEGNYDTAGIDFTQNGYGGERGRLLRTIVVYAASSASTTISVPSINSLEVGMAVSANPGSTGETIPAGTVITALTRNATAPDLVTVNNAVTVPSGQAVVFDSQAPAIRLPASEKICFNTNTDCISGGSGGGAIAFSPTAPSGAVGFELGGIVVSGPVLRMAQGQSFAFDDNSALLQLEVAGALTTTYSGTTISSLSNTGNLSILGSIAPSTTGGIVGTTAANNATAGSDGEYLSAINSGGTTMVTNTSLNLTSLVLTAGDWDVTGSGQLTCSGGATGFEIGVNTTSATLPGFGQYATLGGTALAGTTMSIPTTRFNVSASTNIYAVGQQTCSSGTLTGYAMLRARRVR